MPIICSLDLDQDLINAMTVEETDRLIKAGANVNATDRDGETALMKASTVEQTKLLIEAGADTNATSDYDGDTALMFANTHEQTRLLLESKAYVNARNFNGKTALMLAKTAEQIKILNEFGADINMKDIYGNKAINISYYSLEMMKAYISMGADVESVGFQGRYPIQIACKNRYYDIVKFLLEEAGVDPSIKDCFGHDSFHYADGDARLQEILAPYRTV